MRQNETVQQTLHFGRISRKPTAPLFVIAVSVFTLAVASASCVASVVWQWVQVHP